MSADIKYLAVQVDHVLKNNDVVFAGLFGSQIKGTALPHSDFDFLVEFHPKKKYTLLDLAALQQDLEQALEKPVVVVTSNGLDRYIKQEVLNTVVPIYDQRLT